MANCVDAAMQTMQASEPKAAINRVRAQPNLFELSSCYDAVLALS